MKTLLQIVQAVQGELGLQQSSVVIGNADRTTQQLLALAQRCLDELRTWEDARWTAMQFEYNLVVSPPVITTGNIAADSAVLTGIANTTGVTANFWVVNGDAIPNAARVLSVDSATQVTMTMEATGASTGVALTFSRDTYPIPSDFDFFNNDTMWDRTNFWRLLGPDSPQADQWHRSGIYTTGPRRHFRKIGPYSSTFRIWPQPVEITAPLQLVFEYLSLNAVNVNGAGTSFAQYFANDNDTPLLNDQAIIMGMKAFFFEIKGFNAVNMFNRWVDYVNKLSARDGGAKTLSLVKRPESVLLTPSNIQDGSFPGPSSSSS